MGNDSRYLIQTHSQTKASGIKLSEVHSVDKGINPNIKTERHLSQGNFGHYILALTSAIN